MPLKNSSGACSTRVVFAEPKAQYLRELQTGLFIDPVQLFTVNHSELLQFWWPGTECFAARERFFGAHL